MLYAQKSRFAHPHSSLFPEIPSTAAPVPCSWANTVHEWMCGPPGGKR